MDFVVVFLTLLFVLIPVYFFTKGSKKETPKEEGVELTQKKDKKHKQQHKAAKPSQSKHKKKHEKFKVTHHTPDHAFYLNTIHGISGPVVDFDITPDCTRLAAICEDKTVRLFDLKSLEDDKPVYWLGKLEYETPTACALSYNNRRIAVAVDDENTIVIFEGKDKKLVQVKKFATRAHPKTIKSLHYAMDDKCLISCGSEDDTVIRMWSADGTLLDSYNTNHVTNYRACKSLNGEMFTVATWMGNPTIMEVVLNKGDHSFKSHSKAMVLEGHKQGVHAVGISNTLARAVTACKDKTLTVWKTDVQYKLNEKPRRIHQMDMKQHEFTEAHLCEIYTFESGHSILAISHENRIAILDAETQETLEIINEAHAETINEMLFRRNDKLGILYLLTTAQDGKINIWKLPYTR